uniref:Uncharacterized protein n=1 Tax=Arundo donax TaxID=35708 RepID=A0A0A9F0D2_ARUDO
MGSSNGGAARLQLGLKGKEGQLGLGQPTWARVAH